MKSSIEKWEELAKAHGLNLPASELERIAQPLAALEATFRPLVNELTPDMEPDLELHLAEQGE